MKMSNDKWKMALVNSSLLNLSLRQNRSHLENRNHRQEANEQKQQRKEETNRADEHCPIPLGRLIESPGGGQEIPVQAGHYDHEPLAPPPHSTNPTDHPP